MDTDRPDPRFTCPACGYVTTYAPARCWRGTRNRRGEGGRAERTTFLLVRCAGCGRQEEVVTGRG
jgi:ribosomal protein S27E